MDRHAWIRAIPPDKAEGKLKEVYDYIAGPAGPVANILQVQSLDPDALSAHMALYRRLMFGPSPLSRTQREAIAVAVSEVNRCYYCIEHHSAALRAVSRDEAFAKKMESAEGRAGLDEPLRAILAFAEKLVREPASMAAADVMTLRGHGLSDEAILHVTQIVAYFSFVNRIADGLGVKLEK